ncbi:MAG: hypothetical protein KF799_11075 [Bdellovibrionales bacterium]|nr:hypothetical protein [Bdellovibrionales bacterium]
MIRYLLLAGSLFLTACSAAKFESNKQATLAKSSIFGDEYSGDIKQPAEDDGASGGINQPSEGNNGGANGSIEDAAEGVKDVSQVSFTLVCSDEKAMTKTSFKRALSQSGKSLQLKIGNALCTSDKAKIEAIVKRKTFSKADAQALCPAAAASAPLTKTNLVVDGNSNTTLLQSIITIIYANHEAKIPAAEAADELCDRTSSPLVIHLNSDPSNPQPIRLSSQARGVLFPLLGVLNKYEDVQISWFTNADYGMLALPNASGMVESIDDLFGNATLGPDGKLATDGYAALAKYDDNKDGRIDAADAVFKHLRIWVDLRRDGIGKDRELMSLRQARIEYIDLQYSNDYAETDKYGNETKMKSVVGRSDGSLDLIFDLWFAYRAR